MGRVEATGFSAQGSTEGSLLAVLEDRLALDIEPEVSVRKASTFLTVCHSCPRTHI